MAVYTIVDDIEETSFSLIAIHTVLEDYRLAFFLNKTLQLQLSRLKQTIKHQEAKFQVYEWFNELTDVYWNLIPNKKQIKIDAGSVSLFNEETTKNVYLVNEVKQADFFLKIDADGTPLHINTIVQNINTIQQVATSYEVAVENLKTKDQLNFAYNA